MNTPETVCPTCGGRGHLYPDAPRGKTVPACPQCHGTGRIPAQRSGTTRQLPKGLACPICGYRGMDTHGHTGSDDCPLCGGTGKNGSDPCYYCGGTGNRPDTSNVQPSTSPSAGEGELEQILDAGQWGDYQRPDGEWSRGLANRAELIAAINAYIARRVLEVIGEDESEIEDPLADPTEQAYNYNHEAIARNELRAQQRQRIAVIEKESQQ